MPSVIPSYVYTLFASLIIGTLIITTCGLTVANLKRQAEEQQLFKIAEYVAVKSMQLTSHAPADNLTSTTHLDIPPLIGNQRYWVQIENDSSKVWVEVGFGTTVLSTDKRVYIPTEVLASGNYISGSAATAFLQYEWSISGANLNLFGGS